MYVIKYVMYVIICQDTLFTHPLLNDAGPLHEGPYMLKRQ